MRWLIALLVTCSLVYFVACNEEEETEGGIYFSGRVYDGATGEQLTDYDIVLTYRDKSVDGGLGPQGRYFLGPLAPYHDFTITIRAAGYRTLVSHNAFHEEDQRPFGLGGLNLVTDRSYYFDAYVFPSELKAPPVTFYITLGDSEEVASGNLRLRPTSAPSLMDEADEIPAGVQDQLWHNDANLQLETVNREFTDGSQTLGEGALVYGVSYDVTIYGVEGYAEFHGTFKSGFEGNQAYVLNPLSIPAISLALVTTEYGEPIPNGQVVFYFNQPIELDPRVSNNTYREMIDDAVSIFSPDADDDDEFNTLKEDERGVEQERGTSLTLFENTLTLDWNPDEGLETTDDDDPIYAVTYGALDDIMIRPIDGMAGDAVSLRNLIGSNIITVPMRAQ